MQAYWRIDVYLQSPFFDSVFDTDSMYVMAQRISSFNYWTILFSFR